MAGNYLSEKFSADRLHVRRMARVPHTCTSESNSLCFDAVLLELLMTPTREQTAKCWHIVRQSVHTRDAKNSINPIYSSYSSEHLLAACLAMHQIEKMRGWSDWSVNLCYSYQ